MIERRRHVVPDASPAFLLISLAVILATVLTLYLATAEAAGPPEPNASLSWIAPADRVDGTPITPDEIAEYHICWAIDAEVICPPGSFDARVVEGTETVVQLPLAPRPAPYNVSFVVRAVDINGVHGLLSDVLVSEFHMHSTADPSAPTMLQFSITCPNHSCMIEPIE